MRKRTSVIWTISDVYFIEIVKKSKSIADICRNIGLNPKGGNPITVKKRIDEMEIDTSHFLPRVDASSFTRKMTKEKFVKKYLIKGRKNTSNGYVKEHILKFDLLEYKCGSCLNSGIYNGKKLTLQMDHIDGDSENNELENLRFLCPNCHSQTKTFAGRKHKIKNFCKCGNPIHKNSERCVLCGYNSNTKIDWPSDEELERMVWQFPTVILSEKLKISDVAIAKRCKRRGIKKPPRGYWSKKQ